MINRKVKFFIQIVTLLIGGYHLKAQSFTGSTYSVFGIGELRPVGSIQSRGMGHTYIGLSSKFWINPANPAANSKMSYYASHVFDFGFYTNKVTATDGDQKENFSQGSLTNVNFFFRFSKKWTGLVGANPYSIVGYTLFDQKDKNTGNEVNVSNRGSGGIAQVYFSNSFNIVKNLSLGVNFKYLFGQITKEEIAAFALDNRVYTTLIEDNYTKVLMDFGLNYSISRPKFGVELGAIYDHGGELDKSRSSTFSIGDNIIEENERTGRTQELPRKYGVGASFINNSITLAVDFEVNEWGAIKSPSSDFEYEDTYRYSIGTEYIPDRTSIKFRDRMGYRLGAFVRNNYIKVNGNSINVIGVTGGISMPFRSGGLVNISYQHNNLGGGNSNVITESKNEISIDISIRDLWFRQSKYN